MTSQTLLSLALFFIGTIICPVKAQTCGKTEYTETSGNITSPNYPQLYYNNANCTYSIRTSQPSSFTLTFQQFLLENSRSCRYDWVQIRCDNDGYISPKYCGSVVPMPTIIRDNCSQVFIWFRTDSSTVDIGFTLQYLVTRGGSNTSRTQRVRTTTKTATSSSSTQSTKKILTVSTTTTPASFPDTSSIVDTPTEPWTTLEAAPCICEQSDVAAIVLGLLLLICVLGYIALAAYHLMKRVRVKANSSQDGLQHSAQNIGIEETRGSAVDLYLNIPSVVSPAVHYKIQSPDLQRGFPTKIEANDSNLYERLNHASHESVVYDSLTEPSVRSLPCK